MLRILAVTFLFLALFFLIAPLEVRFKGHLNKRGKQVILIATILMGLIQLEWSSEKDAFILVIAKRLTLKLPLRPRINEMTEAGERSGEWLNLTSLYTYVQKRELAMISRPYLFKLFKDIKLKDLCLNIEIGTGDAAETGVLVGLVWSLVGSFINVLNRYLGMIDATPRLSVIPNFQNLLFAVDIDSIIQLRVGYVIIVIIKLAIVQTWNNYFAKGARLNDRASYPRLNENCNGKY